MIDAGTVLEIKFNIKLPKAASEEEVNEWLQFELNVNGSMKIANPLHGEMVEPDMFTFGWEVG